MDVDKNLTFVLTIKDRAPFTFRWMTYANKVSFPFKILIADGGKDKSVTDQLSNTGNYPNLNYEYIKYPYDKTYYEYFAKLSNVVSRVSTPYVVLGDDDDFFIVDGLRKGVIFLQNNPDYGICGGRVARFNLLPDMNSTYGKSIEYTLLADVDSITDATAMQRIQTNFRTYMSTFYDIHLTSDQKKNFEALRDLNPDNLILAELLISFSVIARKKSRREPYLHLLRQTNPLNSSAAIETATIGDSFDRMLLDSWSKDFTGFIKVLAQGISETDGISIDEATSAIKMEYRKFMSPMIVDCLYQESVAPRKAIISVPKKRFMWRKNIFIKKVLRPIYHWLQDRTSKTSRARPITPSSVFYKDIQPIHDFLTSK